MVWELISFAAILALGFVLRLYSLGRNGFGNEYYSAGVFSMTRSLHNFFFNAFDPAGVLAVDKPPVALWVQVLSAKLFGFAPLSVLVPQGIEGMVSVAVVWHLTRRRFGVLPGLLAAFLLATTPLSVAVDRSSNTDSCLVMVLVLAAWALLTAAERGSWRLLLLAMALVGVGFNVKMMAAFVVLPGFALTYWLGAGAFPALRRRTSHFVSWPDPAADENAAGGQAFAGQRSVCVMAGQARLGSAAVGSGAVGSGAVGSGAVGSGAVGSGAVGSAAVGSAAVGPTAWDLPAGRTGWRRLRHLAAAGVVCLAVSLAWVGAVELTPASERPFVDSSPSNSMLDLVVDHNGVQRFFPRTGTRPAERPYLGDGRLGDGRVGDGRVGDERVGDGRVPAGPLRLADPRLATQVEWLLPLAVLGGVSALTELFGPGLWGAEVSLVGLSIAAPAALGLVLWFGWLLAYAIVYSAAGGLFSAYYLVTLAPPLAVLASVGFASLWARWRQGRRGWWLLPVTLILGAGWQVWLIVPPTEIGGAIDAVTAAESGRTWLALTVMGGAVAAVLGLVLAPQPREAKGAAAFGLLALLAAPALWTAETAFAHVQGARPEAVLGAQTELRRWRGEPQADAGLAEFLRANAREASDEEADAKGVSAEGPNAKEANAKDVSAKEASARGASARGGSATGPSATEPSATGPSATEPVGVGPGATGPGATGPGATGPVGGGTRFLAATVNAREAAPLILATGAPVLAMGGFIGNVPVVTLPALQALVASGQVRFVLLEEPERTPGAGPVRRFGGRRPAVQQAITEWVHQRGVLVDPNRWHAGPEAAADGTRPVVTRLYDLADEGE
jgi:4-amino-4-deoxy-L-arabinose transferase-like glycosyltransferase